MSQEDLKAKRLENLAKARAARASKARGEEVDSSRMDREFEDRNFEMVEPYRPPGTLPDIDPGSGYKMRWVRRALGGNLDNINLHRAHQDGWRPMTLSDYPQYATLTNVGASDVEIGDLVAMRNTVERVRARDKYYASLSNGKLTAIDKEYREMDNTKVKTLDENSRAWQEGRL